MQLGVVSDRGTLRGIGIVAPYDLALDRELWRWVPEDVTLYVTRTPYQVLPVTVEMAEVVSDEKMVQEAARSVLAPEPSVVVYACTSGSFVGGMAAERRLCDVITDTGAPTAVTATGALVQALAVFDARRVAVATPYVADVTAHLHAFFAEAGVLTVASSHLGLLGEIWRTSYTEVADLIRAADHPEADAIVVSCTNLPSYDVIAPLESELGKPIVSSNQAMMWAALRSSGIRAIGPGQRLIEQS